MAGARPGEGKRENKGGSILTLRVPNDFHLARDYCSYGYFLLAPNHWDPPSSTLFRVLDLAQGPTVVRVNQAGLAQGVRRKLDLSLCGKPLRVRASRTLSRPEQTQVKRLLSRMLRLDEDAAMLAAFHRLDPRWKRPGRGRLMRSPTLFEDIVKTVTSCNVTWPGTIGMNRRLCEVLGAPIRSNERFPFRRTFPSAEKIGRTRATTLRGRCRVGYRDGRLIELARLFRVSRNGEAALDAGWFENPGTPDDAIHDVLLSLPGIGPYAAANIMQLLGRYDRLPLDSESVRHGRDVLGYVGRDAQVMKKVAAHFEPFGEHAFRSYWFEMWVHYEKKAGPSWTWRRETDAAQFIASKL
jgi:3-methyladenine DNA glycosylase/8-oxoguanine DNA glycosylase